MTLTIALIAIITIVAISANNWRQSVKLVFILLVFEGALRKWVLPQASEFIYFFKDLVLVGAYLKFFFLSNCRPKFAFKDYIIKIFVGCIAIWCVFQAFNPSLGSPIVGLFGLRGYLFYMPLMWLLPELFESEDDLYKFLRHHLLLLVPVGILGIAQFLSPISSPLNVYAGGIDPNAGFAGLGITRVTGTFSYLSGYSNYLGVCFALLLPMLTIKQSPLWRLLTIVEISLLAINSFMTGARGLVFFEVLFLVCYLGSLALRQRLFFFKTLRQLAIPAFLGVIVVSRGFQSAIDAFMGRATNANDDVSERILGAFTSLGTFFQYKQLDGFGTGAAHQASNQLRRVLGLPFGEELPPNEGEMGRVLLELGPIGFGLWYGFRLFLLLSLWRVSSQLKRPFLQQLALAVFWLQAIQITSHLVFHHSYSVYYWALSSFIFLLPNLERSQKYQQLTIAYE